jgi:4-coumarate--CoA ligase
LDRKKELLKYNSLQISPSQMEALLNSHPLILDSAVTGVKDGDGNDLPRAYIVRQNYSLTEQNIGDFVGDNVADFIKLRGGVIFVDKIEKVLLLWFELIVDWYWKG